MKSNIEFLYEELRKATDGGSESMTHTDALDQIKYWRDKCSVIHKATGGPAFPVGTAFQGITKRDYFAAQMLASVFSSQARHPPDPEAIAKAAYLIADAMMEARG